MHATSIHLSSFVDVTTFPRWALVAWSISHSPARLRLRPWKKALRHPSLFPGDATQTRQGSDRSLKPTVPRAVGQEWRQAVAQGSVLFPLRPSTKHPEGF
jgi:hypothetical protein